MLLFAVGCGVIRIKAQVDIYSFSELYKLCLGADLGSSRQQAVEIDYDIFMAGLTDAMMDGDLVNLEQERRGLWPHTEKVLETRRRRK